MSHISHGRCQVSVGSACLRAQCELSADDNTEWEIFFLSRATQLPIDALIEILDEHGIKREINPTVGRARAALRKHLIKITKGKYRACTSENRANEHKFYSAKLETVRKNWPELLPKKAKMSL